MNAKTPLVFINFAATATANMIVVLGRSSTIQEDEEPSTLIIHHYINPTKERNSSKNASVIMNARRNKEGETTLTSTSNIILEDKTISLMKEEPLNMSTTSHSNAPSNNNNNTNSTSGCTTSNHNSIGGKSNNNASASANGPTTNSSTNNNGGSSNGGTPRRPTSTTSGGGRAPSPGPPPPTAHYIDPPRSSPVIYHHRSREDHGPQPPLPANGGGSFYSRHHPRSPERPSYSSSTEQMQHGHPNVHYYRDENPHPPHPHHQQQHLQHRGQSAHYKNPDDLDFMYIGNILYYLLIYIDCYPLKTKEPCAPPKLRRESEHCEPESNTNNDDLTHQTKFPDFRNSREEISRLNDITPPRNPSGTKLRCPFCERTYGYETNLRAHIRQRHQGIRVSCPYCPRTFTRNNTVRRHVAREHRHLSRNIPTRFTSTRIPPDPISAQQMAAVASATSLLQPPSPNTSGKCTTAVPGVGLLEFCCLAPALQLYWTCNSTLPVCDIKTHCLDDMALDFFNYDDLMEKSTSIDKKFESFNNKLEVLTYEIQ
ncbi:unnamed protein product [Lepeophtheirus salmonis]|uniref:(salmon louse) hypothetical protein n=1 Tax=Lepeophtheirus salmonis TaxID=72036 RepID=A0A7R8D158_LEPSM|nr:unnamed protein product [Lepeophtheirus salmonis]CAF2947590.1 unnamed protein product [Lepeophtheirus salmonis]